MAACTDGAVNMENRNGQLFPLVDADKCTDCGICLEVCPGIDIDPFELRYVEISESKLDGPYLESYTAYSNDLSIRKNSTSGGLITTLVTELIKDRVFDVAFTLPFDTFTGKPARLKATTDTGEILRSAKSKYIPASVHDIVISLSERPDLRYIVVGTSCQIHGIKKFLNMSKIAEDNILFLGLFCIKTFNFNIIRFFQDTYGKAGEKLVKFEFRTKEKGGWPGNSKVYFDSGRELIIDKAVRGKLSQFFQLKRCLFCADKFNRLADISFGDCYIAGKGDSLGKSSVIIRTEKGKEVFYKYSYLFTLERERIEDIRMSQSLIKKKESVEYSKVFVLKHNLYPDSISRFEINNEAAQRLSKLYRHIKWGEEYRINRIKCSLLILAVRKVATRLGKMGHYAIRQVLIIIAILESISVRRWSSERHVSNKATRGNVLIVGAGLQNKGAQAMLFATVDEIETRLPDKNIYLLHTQSFELDETVKSVYKFNILPWEGFTYLGFFGNLLTRKKYKWMRNDITEVIKKADFFVDISGFALSSSAGYSASVSYLANIVVARRFSVPYYILPQSIGPFNYPIRSKLILYPLMSLCLRYCQRIFARESEGVNCVRRFTNNVEKSYDIVLQSRGYDQANIYQANAVYLKDIKIQPDSVGIITNYHLILRASPKKVYSMYCSLINRLIDADKTIYILRHADDDVQLCETIKGAFPNNASVRLIREDLNCIELESIIRQFDFIIASRYHSIIHSYRNGVPALVIGWATKYREISEEFDELEYCFDVRNWMNMDGIDINLGKMIECWRSEKKKIIDRMDSLRKENVFDIFNEYN